MPRPSIAARVTPTNAALAAALIPLLCDVVWSVSKRVGKKLKRVGFLFFRETFFLQNFFFFLREKSKFPSLPPQASALALRKRNHAACSINSRETAVKTSRTFDRCGSRRRRRRQRRWCWCASRCCPERHPLPLLLLLLRTSTGPVVVVDGCAWRGLASRDSKPPTTTTNTDGRMARPGRRRPVLYVYRRAVGGPRRRRGRHRGHLVVVVASAASAASVAEEVPFFCQG